MHLQNGYVVFSGISPGNEQNETTETHPYGVIFWTFFIFFLLKNWHDLLPSPHLNILSCDHFMWCVCGKDIFSYFNQIYPQVITCDTFGDNYTSVEQENDTEGGKLILICAELQYICFSI